MKIDRRVFEDIPGPPLEEYEGMKADRLQELREEITDLKSLVQMHLSSKNLQRPDGTRLSPREWDDTITVLREKNAILDRCLRVSKKLLAHKLSNKRKSLRGYVGQVTKRIHRMMHASIRRGVAWGFRAAAIILEHWADEAGIEEESVLLERCAQEFRRRSNALVESGGSQANFGTAGMWGVLPELKHIRRTVEESGDEEDEDYEMVEAFQGIDLTWLEGKKKHSDA